MTTTAPYNIYEGGSAVAGIGPDGQPLKVIGTRDASGQTTMLAQTPATGTAPTTPSTPATSTIGDIYGNAGVDQASADYQKYLDNPDAYLAGQGVSVSDLKNKTLAEMQAQIDSTNAMYASKLREAKIQGNSTLGSSAAIQGRRGLLGSDFGSAITTNIERSNQDIYDTIDNERAAKINDLMNEAQTKAETRFAEARAAKEAGLKNYVENLKGKQAQMKTGATESVAALIASGLDPSHLSESQLSDYAKGYGTSTSAIKEAYKLAKYTSDKTAADEKKKRDEVLADKALEQEYKIAFEQSKPVSLSEGGRLYDPKTGKQIAYNPKTFAPKDDGTTGAAVSPATMSTNLSNLIGTTKEALGLVNAAGPSNVTKWWTDTFQGDSKFRQLEALTDAVRTNLLTLNTDPSIKKFFGPQMSNADVALMTSAATPLNVQKMTPAQVKTYITQAQDVFVRAKAAVDKAGGITTPAAPETVTIKTPDGRTGTIPKANLEAALAKGAKLVQ